MKNIFRRYWAEIFLILTAVLIFITNYTPGTYLLGWDSLSTELNPALGIKRSFFSVWQEYQSFGLVAGMAHAADLVRAVFIWVISFLIPQSAVRYVFQVLMLLIGSLGVLQLLRYSLDKEKSRFAFLGALFYTFNFFIIQLFFLPFEPFSIFAAILPWNVLIFLKILEQGFRRRNTISALAVFIISTPAFVAQQNFVVLMLILGLISLGIFLKNRTRLIIKRSVLSFLLITAVHMFWILPQAYFVADNISVTKTSKINQLSTEDVFYRNKDKGNLQDFFSNTGFFYESRGLENKLLFEEWKIYRENLPVQIIISTLALIAILGFFKSSSHRLPFLLCYILVVFALLNNTSPVKELNDLLRNVDFINQIFRSPFTKFGQMAALVSAYFFVNGVILISQGVLKITKSSHLSYIVPLIFVPLILIQAFPVFKGEYFSKEMRVKLPSEYKALFEYFKTVDKNSRIALLPEYTYWGWLYQNFPNPSGYNGSGFIWYGIEQPIVSRNFDMWSKNSENYFWEAKEALESEDIDLYNRVLQKYNINYIILDESSAPVIASMKTIQYDRLKTLLKNDPKMKLERKWGFISVYRFAGNNPSSFIKSSSVLPASGPEAEVLNYDTIYRDVGNYVVGSGNNLDRYYPFIDLTTQKKRSSDSWQVIESEGFFQIVKRIPFEAKDFYISNKGGQINANLYLNDTPVAFVIPYTISLKDNIVTVQFPKVLLKDFIPAKDISDKCVNENSKASYEANKGALLLRSEKGSQVCVTYTASGMDQKYGYLIKIGNKNYNGQRLFFSLIDQTKNQPYIEDRLTQDLSYYVVSNRYNEGLGYSFYLQSSSFKTIAGGNELTNLSLYFMPYEEIRNIFLEKKNSQIESVPFNNTEGKKINYYLYSAKINPSVSNLILLQSYDPGWKAYAFNYKPNFFDRAFPFFFGRELKDHVIVNNWANGWTLREQSTINNQQSTPIQSGSTVVIVFLPQYLQFLGFLMLGGLFMVIGLMGFKSAVKRLNLNN